MSDSTELKPCPFCGGKPRHLEQKIGFWSERVICDSCQFSLSPSMWNKRAALAAAPSAGKVKRDRDDDRVRFPDPQFNKWLDEGVSDAHTVWDVIGDTAAAWSAWGSRPYYDAPSAAPGDAQTVRNAALEDAAQVCQHAADLRNRERDKDRESGGMGRDHHYAAVAHAKDAESIRALKDAAAPAAPSGAQWISVKDRVPTHLYSVLGYITEGPLTGNGVDPMLDVVSYDPKAGTWLQSFDEEDVVVTVTHWQDLPDAP